MTGLWKEAENDAEKMKEDVEHAMNKALGAVVNPVIECADVDGIVRRIDVNDVVGEYVMYVYCIVYCCLQ